MTDSIALLVREITDLRDRVNNILRQGKVTEVDHSKGLVKFKSGDYESPWLTWAEQAGGAYTRTMPKVGQAVTAWFPGGNPEMGFATPGHDTEANPLPDAPDGEHVYKRGDLTITQKDDSFTIAVGGVSLVIDATGVHYAGGTIDHDGHAIDKTHTHKGVTPGGALTGTPP